METGSEGSVTFDVENISGGLFNGYLRVVLVTPSGARRNILSEVKPISLEPSQSATYTLNILAPDNLTFGDRLIRIEYFAENEYPLPLKDSQGLSVDKEIITKRTISSELELLSTPEIPENVYADDTLEFEFKLRAKKIGTYSLSLIRVDNILNTMAVLGVIEKTVDNPGEFILTIPAEFSDFSKPTTYRFILVENNATNKNSNGKYIAGENGVSDIFSIYVKNKLLEYSNKITLLEPIVAPNPYYDWSLHPFTVSIRVHDVNEFPDTVTIRLKLLNDTADVIGIASTSFEITEAGDYERNIDLKTHILPNDGSISANTVSIAVTCSLYNDDHEEKYAAPLDQSVLNPDKVTVLYRNLYDLFVITSDLHLDTLTYNKGDNFALVLPCRFRPENLFDFASGAVVTTNALLKDNSGNIYTIGSQRRLIYPFETLSSIPCTIPEDLAPGNYTLYIKLSDFMGNDNPERDKVYGEKSTTIDEIYLTIL